MRKMSVLFGLVVFTLFTGSISFAQGHAKPMSNDDVVTMVKAGLPDATVISAIHAQETNFDDSASALVNLKKQGVSSKIMDAMLAASSKHRDSAATPPAAAGESATPPASGTQNSASPAAGQPQASTAAPAHHSGFFGRLRQVQDQVNGSMQQAQGAVQQAQGTVQQAQGTVQSPLGQQSSAPGQTVAPATLSATPDTATAQANVVQAQQVPIRKRNAVSQQQYRQLISDRQQQAKQRAACRQQAAKAHPEGGTGLVNAYMACAQTNVKLPAK